MIHKLENVLETTHNSQIISVIELDTAPVDFDDITIKKILQKKRFGQDGNGQ